MDMFVSRHRDNYRHAFVNVCDFPSPGSFLYCLFSGVHPVHSKAAYRVSNNILPKVTSAPPETSGIEAGGSPPPASPFLIPIQLSVSVAVII